jgi:D-xylulose 5-phosphate/D-fructose 6-phosphate phosphoketolase
MASRYLLTGRHGLFPCYEAFVAIVDSMMAQYAKLLKQAAEVLWRKPVSSGSRSVVGTGWTGCCDITTGRPEPEHRMSFRTLRARPPAGMSASAALRPKRRPLIAV